jgi:hypothetical protein
MKQEMRMRFSVSNIAAIFAARYERSLRGTDIWLRFSHGGSCRVTLNRTCMKNDISNCTGASIAGVVATDRVRGGRARRVSKWQGDIINSVPC